MKNYLSLMQEILDNGTWQSNRTGVDAISIPGAMLKFDLAEGFPAVTTKKLFFDAVKAELIGFIRGYTNAADFRSLGCKIWDQNANENKAWLANPNRIGVDDLGRIYGAQWTDQVSITTKVKRNFKWQRPVCLPTPMPEVELDLSSNRAGLVGKTFASNAFGRFRVVKEYYVGKHLRYDIQFEETGFLQEGRTKQQITVGEVRDFLVPSVHGVACLGGMWGNDEGLAVQLKPTWEGMISRCYRNSDPEYDRYGGSGVFVCRRWLNFSNFLADFKSIPGWELKLTYPDDYSIDKDFEGSNKYGPGLVRFAPRKEQVLNSKQIKPFKGKCPDGNVYFFCTKTEAVEKFPELTPIGIGHCLAGYQREHAGWKFKHVGSTHRYRIVNQLKEAVAKIKNDPTNRRIIVNAWRPDELDQMALPPCHLMYQFIVNVERNELSLCWYQRSNDCFLGSPFNIASYALLLSMVAQVTGFKARHLTYFAADTHIYRNHLEQVEEQLSRKPFKLPTLKLNNEVKDLLDFDVSDIELLNYKHHPAIAAPMAV